ncbi:(2Fe-2S)-binding protein [Anoxybacter fermentans]|uniref:(2Fe-2S)-binding protein n=1 Tax=Anoxybacter fermentans TaxID=1323375 RepID=A0A3S9SZB7_9FIRM|nr:(2Fe-2S)-binding protein [Anoxybacter fermentans]AZR73600.1 (2Fe-2S)-binding protein [Anoxybacter fermentans]
MNNQNNQIRINISINGESYEVQVDPEMRLIDLLRDKLGFTGTKEGCGKGECGACTVIMDGKTVNSCLVLAFQADGKEILTIEGMGTLDNLHPIQEAFIRNGAVQCGYCIPGMVLSAKSLLDKNPAPTEEEIRRGISGNLCRCTGYQKIVDAIKDAAAEMRGDRNER